ncbi:helix-turn-helix domain-containing protein [Niveispirillum cyanobacteriorum]|uniref:helix-turn-helix domain-containing protein n=1 Tax=Niveispirillum cyanobacteriorum TaxID=1612173 RepID=UPI001FEA46F1|nr:helix-turn-helix domain-containing protein [Niveispirillum cyanobacteriorum]
MNSTHMSAMKAEKPTHAATDLIGAISVADFLSSYSIGRTSFYKEVAAGRITIKKIGRRTLIPRAAAEAWLNSLKG